ncbi:hypothetical protein C882_2635 [Caenispirillum salinarum AK4]|uniref:Amine oxidase domain-containing protein n=1 Tax=Caenispirillum salinarum AK4 TaxID=1238182 RepID=K9HWH1_9PROT|nr:hypothetical protein C882_2635 [Caenispirillum salinarum AK4]
MHHLPTPLRIAIGFAPWMVYGAGLAASAPMAAAALGLGAAILLAIPDMRRRRVKAPDLVAAVYFAAHLGASAAGWPVFEENGAALVLAVLAVMAWGSLAAGTPFTLQYARERWPRVLWDAPEFKAVNAAVTSVWGLCFTAAAGLAWLGTAVLLWAGPVLLLVGIVASVVLPEMLPRLSIRQSLRRKDPWPWAPPLVHQRDGAEGYDVAVVGAGIGGLAAAAALTARGARVAVFESHDRPGGCCSSWVRKVRMPEGSRADVIFDAGVHDVSGVHSGGTLDRFLARVGAAERLTWVPMHQSVTFPFGTLTIGQGAEALAESLAALVPADAAGLRALVGDLACMDAEMARSRSDWGAPHVPATVDEALAYPMAHPHLFRWMERPWPEFVAAFVSTPEGRAAADALAGYLTDQPDRLTVLQMLPLFAYAFHGGAYPVGGSQALADALAAVVEAGGGMVRTRTPVARILMRRGAAAGVETASGEMVSAAAVVMNTEARRLPDLLPDDALPPAYARALAAAEPGPSAFMSLLLIDHVPDGPTLRTLRESGEGGLFLTISPPEAQVAPPGCAAVSVIRLLPRIDAVGWHRGDAAYADAKRAMGDHTLALAEALIPGLRRHIVYRQDATPATFGRYLSTHAGAIYGPAVDAYRPAVRTPVPGLVLAGASAQPGSGVEAVVISGLAAAEALMPAADARASMSTDAARWSASASSAASTPAA